MFGLRELFFWEPPDIELSYQLSYSCSIWQVCQLYGGWPFSLHTILFGTRPYGYLTSMDHNHLNVHVLMHMTRMSLRRMT